MPEQWQGIHGVEGCNSEDTASESAAMLATIYPDAADSMSIPFPAIEDEQKSLSNLIVSCETTHDFL